MIHVRLPYPAKLLWPNGRTRNHQAKAAQVRKHREWANLATLEAVGRRAIGWPVGSIPVRIMVTGKAGGPFPDEDNVVASAKSYLDGIAERLGVNDRRFAAPAVEFVGRSKLGAFAIMIGRADS